jgi:hypothetical protein
MSIIIPGPELVGATRPAMECRTNISATDTAPVILLVDSTEGLLVDLNLLPDLLDWKRKQGEGSVLATAELVSAVYILNAVQVDLVVVAVSDWTPVDLLSMMQDQTLNALVIAIADDRISPVEGLDVLFSTPSFQNACPLCLRASIGARKLLQEICRRAEAIAAEQRLIADHLAMEAEGRPCRVDWRRQAR